MFLLFPFFCHLFSDFQLLSCCLSLPDFLFMCLFLNRFRNFLSVRDSGHISKPGGVNFNLKPV